MSSDGRITIFWGDGENQFRFAIGQFRELQERVNTRRQAMNAPLIGPMSLLNLLRTNDAWPDDVRDILRIGLIGGGMSPQAAHQKLVQYFDRRPLLESNQTALAILLTGLVGDISDQEDVKKKTTVETKPAQSDLAKSTEQALH